MYQVRKIDLRQSRLLRIHSRELRFLALVLVTCCLIALQLSENLRLQGLAGSDWRTVDLPALQRRIDAGDLSDHEATWYHPAKEQERRASGAGQQP